MVRKALLVISILACGVSATWGQSVDDVIAKHVAARGGMDKLKAVKTMRATAKMEMGAGMEFPGVLIVKRPASARLEFTVQGLTAVQAYDGKIAWQIMPFTGKKDPEVMTADEQKEMEEQADMDGPIVDYKSKRNQVEMVGKEKAEGADVIKLKVTLKNGDVKYVYLDADNYLQVKEETKRTVRGSEQEIETIMGDYKEVDGVMMAFAFEGGIKGHQEKQKITLEKIEINVPVEDALFKMPPPAPKPPVEAPKN
jgi:outer membrane lipoprotein-sorting protein